MFVGTEKHKGAATCSEILFGQGKRLPPIFACPRGVLWCCVASARVAHSNTFSEPSTSTSPLLGSCQRMAKASSPPPPPHVALPRLDSRPFQAVVPQHNDTRTNTRPQRRNNERNDATTKAATQQRNNATTQQRNNERNDTTTQGRTQQTQTTSQHNNATTHEERRQRSSFHPLDGDKTTFHSPAQGQRTSHIHTRMAMAKNAVTRHTTPHTVHFDDGDADD